MRQRTYVHLVIVGVNSRVARHFLAKTHVHFRIQDRATAEFGQLPHGLCCRALWQWRRTIFCRATGNGTIKKGYSGELVSPMVYFLRLYQV
jgi:hypothetical protein